RRTLSAVRALSVAFSPFGEGARVHRVRHIDRARSRGLSAMKREEGQATELSVPTMSLPWSACRQRPRTIVKTAGPGADALRLGRLPPSGSDGERRAVVLGSAEPRKSQVQILCPRFP